MWARMMKKNYFFINIPLITSSIRVHKERISNTSQNVEQETNRKVIEYIENLSKDEMISFEGSENNFYLVLKKYYELYGKTNLLQYINKQIENLNSDNKNQ